PSENSLYLKNYEINLARVAHLKNGRQVYMFTCVAAILQKARRGGERRLSTPQRCRRQRSPFARSQAVFLGPWRQSLGLKSKISWAFPSQVPSFPLSN